MTEGDSFRQTIANVPTTTNSATSLLDPVNPVVIDGISLVADTTDGVLELTPAASIGKSFTVDIVITDGVAADKVTVPLTVSVAQDPTPPLPYLLPTSPVNVVSGQSVGMKLSAYIPVGDTATFAYDSSTPGNGAAGFSSFSGTTGQTTVAAASNFAGQTELLVGVDSTTDSTGNYDSQYVPVYVTPAAPLTITLTSPAVPGWTDATAVKSGVTFTVSGIFAGADGRSVL